MHKNIISKTPYLILALVIACIDQYTKIHFIEFFKQDFSQGVNVFPFLNFVYAWNQGISFGMFDGFNYSNLIFTFLSVIITFVIMVMMFKNNSIIYSISYSLIIGGAVGNIVDRVSYSAVFDFIDFHIGHYHWPAFNIADSSVCVGALLFVIASFKLKN